MTKTINIEEIISPTGCPALNEDKRTCYLRNSLCPYRPENRMACEDKIIMILNYTNHVERTGDIPL